MVNAAIASSACELPGAKFSSSVTSGKLLLNASSPELLSMLRIFRRDDCAPRSEYAPCHPNSQRAPIGGSAVLFRAVENGSTDITNPGDGTTWTVLPASGDVHRHSGNLQWIA